MGGPIEVREMPNYETRGSMSKRLLWQVSQLYSW